MSTPAAGEKGVRALSRALKHFRLSNPEAPADPIAAWRTTLAPVFDVVPAAEQGPFRGDLEAWATARFVLSVAGSSSVTLLRTAEAIARCGIDHFAIRSIVSGQVEGLAGSAPIEAGVGDVLFLDLVRLLKLNSCLEGASMTQDITLWVPRSVMLASISDEDALHGLVLKGATAAGAVIGASLGALAARAQNADVRDLDALAAGLAEMAARALAPPLEDMAGPGAAPPLASFVSIRRFIDRNLRSPDLGAPMIAASFGLSRASLYRLFEPVGGIAGYIRKRRLTRAYQEITLPGHANRRIGPIAYSLGFKNISAFNRAFRSFHGVSPASARAAAQRGGAGMPLPVDPAADASLGRWLMQIAAG